LSKDCGTCSWLDIAKNAGIAVKDAIAYAVEHGHIALEESKVQERLSICASCEYLNGQRCRACGCFVKAKAALASEKCPKNKWGQI
jgi:hypothetical protein